MVEYGVTIQGFRRKTYEEILADMENRARQLFGSDIDLSETSSDGMHIRNMAYELSLLWQSAEDTYNSAYVDTAEGIQLRSVGKYIGIKGKVKLKSIGQIRCNGTAGTVLNSGLRVANNFGIEYASKETVTIGSDGSAYVPIEAVLAGSSGNTAANTITTIVTPIAGLESVTNIESTTGGQDYEEDPEFRDRYNKSVAKGGSSTIDSIRAKLLDEVPGVRAAIVVENNLDIADSNGRPPHSVSAIVLGGNQNDIANAILESKAGGIRAYGSTVVSVKDKSGKEQQIGFSYANQKDIYIRIDIIKKAEYPIDGDERVKVAIIDYIGGTDAKGNIYNGLSMGESVIYNRLVGEVNKIPGILDFTLELSTDGTLWSKSNIAVNEIEVAQTNFSKVAVTSHD